MSREGPAPYSNTDEAETRAIAIFEALLDPKMVKSDLKKRDKYPNIDGYLELVDENREPIGKLEAQVKKLADRSPRGFPCPTSLFSYSRVTGNPVIFVGVDIHENKAYWHYVGMDSPEGQRIIPGQQTIMINFSSENILDGSNLQYAEKWKDLVRSHRSSRSEFQKLQGLYEDLLKQSTPAQSIIKDDYKEMHVFLDEIDDLLERELPIVKRIAFPNAWKVGLAYREYGNNQLSYTLFPIQWTRNDTQIKEVDLASVKQLMDGGLGFKAYFVENPIKSRPRHHATEVVSDLIGRIMAAKLLNHCSELLAREFTFGFTDRFGEQLGLTTTDEFPLASLEEAFLRYMPTWVDEVIKLLVKTQGRAPQELAFGKKYFDPDMLLSLVNSADLDTIAQRVKERTKSEKTPPQIPLGNERYPFLLFYNFLRLLNQNGRSEVARLYARKEYSRLKTHGGLIWNLFPPGSVETNLKIFFQNLPTAYHELISCNFPQLEKRVPLYKGIAKVIVVFETRERYESFTDSPRIEFYFLGPSTASNDITTFDVYQKGTEGAPELSSEQVGKHVEYRRERYQLMRMSVGILDFIYEETPMLNYVYAILGENIKKFLDERTTDRVIPA